jgi:hypothetical protein
MTPVQRIRLLAAATTFNSLMALNLIGSSSALATSCGEITFCLPCPSMTQAQRNSACATQTPPGCTFVNAVCFPTASCGPGDLMALRCNYT